jgi:hypothetical protein
MSIDGKVVALHSSDVVFLAWQFQVEIRARWSSGSSYETRVGAGGVPAAFDKRSRRPSRKGNVYPTFSPLTTRRLSTPRLGLIAHVSEICSTPFREALPALREKE